MQKPEVTKEHRWLQQLVGEWTFEAKGMGSTGEGRDKVRPLDDYWIVGEMEGAMSDGNRWRSLLTMGFDPQRKRFVGSFISEGSTWFWTYDGWLEADGRSLVMEAKGPHWEDPTQTLDYRDVHRIDGPGQRSLLSYVKKPDGDWELMLEVTYRRQS